MRTLHVPRSTITPATSLPTLIHWRTAPSVWAQLRNAVAARNWPSLVRPLWVSRLILGLPLLGGVVLVIGLPPLAEWAFRRSNSLGATLYLVSEMRLFLVIPFMICSWVLLVRLAKRFCFGFPRGVRTVADLVPYVVTSAEMAWTREQIEQKVREIMLAQLLVPVERYEADGRFVEDLGVEVRPEMR